MFTVYLPENNPTGLVGTVGGDISSLILTGYVGELLSTIPAVPTGATTGVYQYRKIFVKNQYTTASTDTKVWLSDVEHPEQISIALGVGSDSIDDATTSPTGISTWYSPYTWVDGLLIGTMNSNSYSGVWIREYLSGVSSSDPYATFSINFGGLVL